MNTITLHDGFRGSGAVSNHPPQEAVIAEAGRHLGTVLPAVRPGADAMVPGGDALPLGRSGLIQSGRFRESLETYGLLQKRASWRLRSLLPNEL